MKRYITINSVVGSDLFDYDITHDTWDESVTDFSYFMPRSEAIKTITGNLSSSDIDGSYDFPNGRDTGAKVPISRQRGIDLAILSEELRRADKAVSDAVSDTKSEAKLRARLKAIGSKSSSSGSGSSSSEG